MQDEIVARVRATSRPSSRVMLVQVDPGRPFPFTAGQAVMAGLATQPVRRPYSIASSPEQVRAERALDLVIGLDGGETGTHLTPLGVGSLVALRGPVGRFGLPARLARRSLLFVAGGAGIAPLRSMMWSALHRLPPVEIDLVYSARTADDLVFDAEFRRLADDGRIRYWPTVTRDHGSSWAGRRGRVDGATLEGALRKAPVALLCGTGAFIDDMTILLRSLGVKPGHIRREEY